VEKLCDKLNKVFQEYPIDVAAFATLILARTYLLEYFSYLQLDSATAYFDFDGLLAQAEKIVSKVEPSKKSLVQNDPEQVKKYTKAALELMKWGRGLPQPKRTTNRPKKGKIAMATMKFFRIWACRRKEAGT
jgi:hypothetical protein